MADDNFYIMLGLDPSVDDWPTIEKCITDKKREWSRASTTGLAKDKLRAKQCLGLIKVIEAELKDPQRRREIAAQAQKALGDKEKKVFEELDALLLNFCRKDVPLTVVDVRKTFNTYISVIGEQRLLDRIKECGYTIETTPRPAKQRVEKPRLEPADSKAITELLDQIRAETLYDFLGLAQGDSFKMLSDRAREIEAQVHERQITPENQARNALVGYCIKVFKNEQEKEKHDNWLAVRKMDSLAPAFAFATSDNFLEVEEIDNLIKMAMERGVNAEDAREYIEDLAAKNKWGMAKQSGPVKPALPQCGFCHKIAQNAADAKCWNCGEKYIIDCPGCKKPMPTVNPACTSCGLRISEWPTIRALLRAGENAVVEGNFSEAMEHFDRCLLYWPGFAPAIAAKKDLEQRHKSREQEIGGIEASVRRHELVAAQAALDQFIRRTGPGGTDTLRKRIADGLAQAEGSCQKADSLRRDGDAEAAFDEYHRAYMICADLEKVRNGLAMIPPPPPANVRASAMARGVGLRWEAVRAKGPLTYRVLRKANGTPNSPTDGECLGEITACALDDTEAGVGTPWHYAVFTVRLGVCSANAARTGPHLGMAEVSDLDTLAGNREVILKWQAPPGSTRVEVWKKNDSLPSKPGDGRQLSVVGSSAHDTGLENGKSYGYLVVAVFPDPVNRGREILTEGTRVTAKPCAPPAAVTDLRCIRTGQMVSLQWTPVPGSMVQIRQSRKAPEFPPGAVVSLQQAESLGPPVPPLSPGSAQVTLSEMGQYYFVPLSMVSGMAVIGKPQSIATVADVVGLKTHVSGKDISLMWTWPEGIEEAVVCYSPDGYPSAPGLGNATRIPITRKEYDRLGMCRILGLAKQPYYFTVFAKVPNAEAYSSGSKTYEGMGHSMTVSYQVVSKRAALIGKRKVWLELSTTDAMRLPAVQLRALKNKVPLSSDEGVLVAEAASVAFDVGKGAMDIPERFWGSDMFVKLFFQDPANSACIRLLPASAQRLKLI